MDDKSDYERDLGKVDLEFSLGVIFLLERLFYEELNSFWSRFKHSYLVYVEILETEYCSVNLLSFFAVKSDYRNVELTAVGIEHRITTLI